MALKNCKIAVMVEPSIEDIFRELATKKGVTASALLRSLIIDELQLHGLLPEGYTMKLLKGIGV